jgi:ABC-2 type transport system permease protein
MISNIKQIFEYRELLRTLVSKDTRSRYKGSVLGFAWNFAIPLLQLLVYWALFGLIFGVSSPGNYPFSVFLFTGLLPWNFLTNALLGGSMSVIGNANLVKKIYFPLQVLPLTTVLSQFISLLLGELVLAIVLVLFGVGLSWYLLLLPVVFAIQLVFIAGLAWFFGCANVFFRDIEHILGIIMMAWMYLTPVLYPITRVTAHGRIASLGIHLNPMTDIITAFQNLTLDHKMPDWAWLGYAAVASVAACVIGFSIFNHFKFRFEEEV